MKIILIILFIFVSAALVGQQLYSENINIDEVNEKLQPTLINSSSTKTSKIITPVLNCMLIVTFEIGKMGIEEGYNNPDTDYRFYVKLIFYILLLLICVPLILPALLLVYLLYLLYLIFIKSCKRLFKK